MLRIEGLGVFPADENQRSAIFIPRTSLFRVALA
jgi:hypothetical protein